MSAAVLLHSQRIERVLRCKSSPTVSFRTYPWESRRVFAFCGQTLQIAMDLGAGRTPPSADGCLRQKLTSSPRRRTSVSGPTQWRDRLGRTWLPKDLRAETGKSW